MKTRELLMALAALTAALAVTPAPEAATATDGDRTCEFCLAKPAVALTPVDEYGICDDCAMPETTRDKIITALDLEGAFCGDCGREPGDPLDDCEDCRRCLNRYADALLPLLAPVPSVEDARAEAERRYTGPRMYVGTTTDREVAAFVAGAEWAVGQR